MMTGTVKQQVSLTPNIFDDAVPVEELGQTGYKFLIFGMSGTGKTTLAADFPKPLLLIRPEEVEDGSRSIRTVKGVVATPPVTEPDQLVDVIEGQRRTQRFKSIVLDGVTRLQDLVVKKHMGMQDVPVQQTWGMVPQADWNRIGITLKEYLRDLMRLAEMGTHVVIVGGERTIGEDKSEVGVPKIMVALTPGTTGWLHEICDYNVHTFKRQVSLTKEIEVNGKKSTMSTPGGKKEYGIHLEEPTCLYGTKFRKPKGMKLPDEIIDPTFVKLQALIEHGQLPPEPTKTGKVVLK